MENLGSNPTLMIAMSLLIDLWSREQFARLNEALE